MMKRTFAILATYAVAFNVQELLLRFAPYRHLYRNFPYWVPESIKTLAGVLLCAAVARALYGPGDHFAIGRRALRGIAFGFVCAMPMIAGFALTRRFAPPPFADVLFLGIVFPFIEELVSRGFAFRMLWRNERWPMWAAMVAVAFITGLGHIERGQSALEILGVFALTGAGGAVFSWLLARWDSLWFPFALHMFMNMSWEVFQVSRIVIGGWFAFALQVAAIALAIGVTLTLTPALSRNAGEGGRRAGESSPRDGNVLRLRHA